MVKTSHRDEGLQSITVSYQALAMANFPSVVGMFLIAGSDGEFGVRKTNDLTYVKDTVLVEYGFGDYSMTHYIQLVEGTNFSYASLE